MVDLLSSLHCIVDKNRACFGELVFPCAGSVNQVEFSRELVATVFLNKECSKSTSTLFKVSFFLVHLFYSSSFGLLNSIKGIGNSTIISLTYFSEFDVISSC